MIGLTQFLIEETDNFKRSLKKIVKSYKAKSQQQEFIDTIKNYLAELITNPYHSQSRNEPWPRGIKLPANWTFHKLVFTFGKGASGQIRLMYFVNEQEGIIKPLWIYTHEQFDKRPTDQAIKDVIAESFDDSMLETSDDHQD